MDPILHEFDIQDPTAVQFCAVASLIALIYFQFQIWRIKRRRKAQMDGPGVGLAFRERELDRDAKHRTDR